MQSAKRKIKSVAAVVIHQESWCLAGITPTKSFEAYGTFRGLEGLVPDVGGTHAAQWRWARFSKCSGGGLRDCE